jgi:hypothetical protein
MILAQAASTGPELWQVVEHAVALSAVAGVIIMWLTYRRKKEIRKIEPDPIRTRRVEPNVKEPVCLERRTALEKQIHELDTYTKKEVGRIHDKIDEVNNRANANFGEVRETLRKMPMEIVRLINEADQVKAHNQNHD